MHNFFLHLNVVSCYHFGYCWFQCTVSHYVSQGGAYCTFGVRVKDERSDAAGWVQKFGHLQELFSRRESGWKCVQFLHCDVGRESRIQHQHWTHNAVRQQTFWPITDTITKLHYSSDRYLTFTTNTDIHTIRGCFWHRKRLVATMWLWQRKCRNHTPHILHTHHKEKEENKKADLPLGASVISEPFFPRRSLGKKKKQQRKERKK